MNRKGWYLVAYDIADPKRLRRVHYRLKKEGLSIQKSVFAVNGNEEFVHGLLDRLAKEISLKKDDLRAYPILHPKQVWTNVPNPMADLPLIHFQEERPKPSHSKKKSFKRLIRLFR